LPSTAPSRLQSAPTPHATPPVSPALVLGLSVLAFSWAAPLIRFTTANALVISFWRLLFAVAVLTVIVTVRPDGWGPLRRLSLRRGLAAVGAGLLLALHFWSWIASVQFTSVASSVILVSTQPLFVAVLSAVFLREHPRRNEWWGLLIAFLGAAAIGWGDASTGSRALLGDLLALSAALLASLYFIVGRSLRREIDIWSYVLLVYGAAALILLPLILLLPNTPLAEGYGSRDWGVFLALALGPMLLGHTGVNYALRYVRAYTANLAVLGEPVGATLIAWLLPAIAETPNPSTLVGGGIILVGIAVAVRPDRGGTGAG
jgi:drug/metabolite transporter (DMT)-like permease